MKQTREIILSNAKQEFLDKGFQKASLRQIMKNSNLTTGAFYGLYKNKEQLFAAIVNEVYETILSIYKEEHDQYESLEDDQKLEHMTDFSKSWISQLFDYIYDHRMETILILKCSEGTKYSGMIDEMVEIETEATRNCYELLEKAGRKVEVHNDWLDHILATGTLNSCCELILHDFTREEMHLYLRKIWEFYAAGWKTILGQ